MNINQAPPDITTQMKNSEVKTQGRELAERHRREAGHRVSRIEPEMIYKCRDCEWEARYDPNRLDFSPDGVSRPALEALPLSNHDLADVTIQALELLMARRNESVYRGRAWMKLNNAMLWISDEFWKETKQKASNI